MSAHRSSQRQQMLVLLSKALHLPAPFISAFLVVHLSAPLVATIGGSEFSSQVLLLGREYYKHSTASEAILVFAPLALHVGAGVLKRIILASLRFRGGTVGDSSVPRDENTPSNSLKRISAWSFLKSGFNWLARSLNVYPSRTLLVTSAYASTLLLPVHVLIHKAYPSLQSTPVDVDFEFVKYGLHSYPMRNIVLYTALVGGVVTHAFEGSKVLYGLYAPKKRNLSKSTNQASLSTSSNKQIDMASQTDTTLSAVIAATDQKSFEQDSQKDNKARICSDVNRSVVLSSALALTTYSLYVLWSEHPHMPLPSILSRYDAAFSQFWLFRM